MPRGHKSKHRPVRNAVRPKKSPCLSAELHSKPTTTSEAGVSYTRANEDAQNQEQPSCQQAQPIAEHLLQKILEKKMIVLVYYLLHKYQMKEVITKADIMENIVQVYKNHYSTILSKASEHLEVVFGLELKETDPRKHNYVLVSKLESSHYGRVSEDLGMPKTGLLMTILGVIFTKGNCATEEEVWEMLNMMGLYAGEHHLIFGEPRKLLTKDLVQQKYLEYQQVPPCYEFLWGPRAYAETTKMKVLEFWAKIHETIPSAFQFWYEKALKDEEERAHARAAAKACSSAMAQARSMATSSSHSNGLTALALLITLLCLLSLGRIAMPRGHKSKLRAQEKRRLARGDPQDLKDAQATVAEEEGPASSSPVLGATSQSAPTAGSPSTSQSPCSALSITTAFAGAAAERAERDASHFAPTRTPLDQKAILLVHFLLRKYKMKETATKEDMLKYVIKKHRDHFHEILRRTTELMVLAFGIDVREVDSTRHCYALFSKLRCSRDRNLPGEDVLPKSGLLMTVLCVIFMKGNSATEDVIWEVLNVMGIHAGKKHFIYGEPRKLITNDLVKEKYLEYRQVPNSEPPRYEFLWGPKALAETSKMEVLEFLARVHNTVPSAFPAWYEEALRDEEEKARSRFAALVRTNAIPSAHLRVPGSSFHF
ncbi:melanoma-associated antigen B18-like [Tenrec ecaudatus]|uniref:melanoma-associated antigen B18-like n=1 Tax=Tenrec ecaudatus TaxID=94439 RepID=UPI003F59F77A